MKKITLVILLVLFVSVPAAAQQWYNISGGKISIGSASKTSLALHSSGTPYVAFKDAKNGNKVTVMRPKDAYTWEVVGTAGFTADTNPQKTSLAFTSTDDLILAYELDKKIGILKYDGQAWLAYADSIVGTGVKGFITLKVGSDDALYIGYMDESYYNPSIRVIKYDGSGWTQLGEDDDFGSAIFMSFDLAPDDTPYLLYYDNGTIVKKYNGTEWETVGTKITAVNAEKTPDLRIDKTGVPYVAHYNTSYKLSVSKMGDSDWELVGEQNISAGKVKDIHLAFDNNNTPFVAYSDDKAATYLTVNFFNGSEWEIAERAGFSTGMSYDITIEVTPNNIPIVAYIDNNGAVAKKYAAGADAPLPIEYNTGDIPAEFSLKQNYPNPFNPETTLSYQLTGAGHVALKVYDITGREIAALVNEVKQAGSYAVHFDAGNLPSGIYFAKLMSQNQSKLIKMTLIK